MTPLTVVSAGQDSRLQALLELALTGLPYEPVEIGAGPLPDLSHRRVLFAISSGKYGLDEEICKLLLHLRKNPAAMEGSYGAMVIDGEGELYTKQLARALALSANGAGCFFPGRSLVDGTGSLSTLRIQAQRAGISPQEAYPLAIRLLADRLLAFSPQRVAHPNILLLHASHESTSNTLDLARALTAHLTPSCTLQEISLRSGLLMDCRGCSYHVCSQYALHNRCFYGGAIPDKVFPAILQADALLLLCPNYNDALSAHITAFINRLTALLIHNNLENKYLYAIIVSGYSGGDLVAQQVLGALSLNKSFMLPPRFCMWETANSPGEALLIPGVQDRVRAFGQNIVSAILSPGPEGPAQ